jgi:hypothetical protein
MNLDTLPIDVIEQICFLTAKGAFLDFEASDFLALYHASIRPCKRFKASSLWSLPLIHPLWRLPGTKVLYRYICITTADEYKAFHRTLELNPTNRQYVRVITIRWGEEDFGGPDGYAYKVLGWFHQIEIQHLIRLCPFLESIDIAHDCPVISPEGIAALGSLTELRSIGLRNVDFQRDSDSVIQVLLNARSLDSLRLYHVADDFFEMLAPIASRIRQLKWSPQARQDSRRWPRMENLRELDVDVSAGPPLSLYDPLRHAAPNLTNLTIRSGTIDCVVEVHTILWSFCNLQFLALGPWTQLVSISISVPWRSAKLVTIQFRISSKHVRSLFGNLGSAIEHIRRHVQRESLPQLQRSFLILYDENGRTLNCENVLPDGWGT